MVNPAVLGQTVQIVDKSGKVVSTSRQLFNVFKIGRDAYNEHKKEIKAKRASTVAGDSKVNRPPGRAHTVDDVESVRSGRSHRSHRSHHSQHPRHEHHGQGETRSPPETTPMTPGTRLPAQDIPAGTPFYEAFPEMMPPPRRHSAAHLRPKAPPHTNSTPAHPHPGQVPPQQQWYYGPPSPSQASQDHPAPRTGQRPSGSRYAPSRAPTALVRRSTTTGRHASRSKRPEPSRRASEAGIDMDLAYGPTPPGLLYPGSPSIAPDPVQDEATLKGLIGKADFLLDEAQCLRHSATSTMAHLQKNPDAMAAVGLTLAEISNLVKKMGPAVLKNLKTMSPAVFALLSHPQFMIAVGVAAGVTIIAFGGYKIVQRIQQRQEMQSVGDEGLLPVEDVSRIDTWRRGIADVRAESDGTSVEGEFITPMARKLSRMNLAEERAQREADSSRGRQTQMAEVRSQAPKSRAGDPARSVISTSSKGSSRRSSSEPRKSGSAKSSATRTTRAQPKGFVRPKTKESKPSPLRRLLMA